MVFSLQKINSLFVKETKINSINMKRVLFCLFALVLMASCAEKPVILTVDGGQIQGVKADIPGVTVFRGIPYAAAPIGDLRWKEPQPVVPWEGVKVCDKFGHPGYQSVHYPGGYTTEWGYGDESPYSEDCLYLNVWTKAPGEVDKKLPVALWIHGGGYREGWGSEPEFDGQEWANKDVVLVSINYRLGVFGFLCHPELSAESPNGVSGNYGILDQIESLKWIKNNIAQFGGDPDNVMIFGQSAGAGSVRTLCESPLTVGLFNKAVIMSGGGLNKPVATPSIPRGGLTLEAAEQQSKEILDWAGLTDLKKMRAASTETLYALSTIKTMVDNPAPDGAPAMFRFFGPSLTGMPVVDGYVSLRSFDEAALTDNLPHIPYMIGYTMDDMGDMSASIADFCLNREELGGVAYAYEFARPLPDDGSQPNVLTGAFHSSDLWFVFKSLKHCWRPWTQGDWDLSEKMLTAWSNFAKTGEPGGEWKAYTKENPNFMVFKLDENDCEASAPGQTIPSSKPAMRW